MILSIRKGRSLHKLSAFTLLTGAILTPSTLLYRHVMPFGKSTRDLSLSLSIIGATSTCLSWLLISLL